MRLPSRPLIFLAGALTVLAGTAIAQSVIPFLLFPDVEESAYFSPSIEDLVRKGIVKGYDDGRFGPSDPVTRGQVAVMLHRYDQEVIEPLRRQIWKIRQLLDLGECGDGEEQIGEECDDGNTEKGDGCSPTCQKEVLCPGRELGESFPAPDGCNTCTCTERGIVCTEKTCKEDRFCLSSAQCEEGEVCSTELGECRSPCPPNAVCIRGCSGICIPKERKETCGNGVCEEGEAAWCPPCEGDRCPGACSKGTCPEDCGEQGAQCGNDVCEEGEATWCPPCTSKPCPLAPCRMGTCPEDCSQPPPRTSCEERAKELDEAFARSRSCRTNEDCIVYIHACSPYLTCGKPINRSSEVDLTAKVDDFAEECQEGPQACAACVARDAECRRGLCMLAEPVTQEPGGQRCATYARDGVKEERCAVCGDSTCSEYESCTPSSCTTGACTSDCGGLYCPGDCP